MKDLTNNKYNRWTVISPSRKKRQEWYWNCICDCGTIKAVRTSHLKGGKSKSCGCLHKEVVKKINSTKKGKKNLNKYVTLNCACCHIEFDKLKSCLKDSKYFYCSKNCRAKHQACYIKGDNHPAYIEDRSSIVDDRRSYEGNQWRLDVFKRDDYKCVACNCHGNIHAHHINSFAKFVDLRYDTANGATLCADCHLEFHGTFGYRDFTPEDFNIFIEDKEEVSYGRK